jgi:hypothetical protein
VADIALDKLTTQLEANEDPEFILDATDKILHRMGYAPASARNPAGSPSGNSIVQNNFTINAADLSAARELMQLTAEQPARMLQANEVRLPDHVPVGRTFDAE